MSGIVRIHIESDWQDWRTKMSRDLEVTSDAVLRKIFSDIGMPLLPGTDIIECTKDEAMSRYDWTEGIDTLLYFDNGTKATMQEKYLDYKYSTATFEERKTSGAPGAWYYCTAQYYFVAYARKYKTHNDLTFQDWVMLDFPGLHRLDQTTELMWFNNENGRDGRRSSFRYLYFDKIPESVVVSRYMKKPPPPVQETLF